MPRDRSRACLNDGIKLNLNSLFRRGFVFKDAAIGGAGRGIAWHSSYWGEIASGRITSDLGRERGWMCVELNGDAPQQIHLTTRPRHFGGVQWYFVCPRTGRLASVLWRPPGATRFYSRQAYGRRVAYRSQFLDPDNRAHWGQSKIKARLLGPGMDPDEWELPPKPPGMRWRTYHRHVQRFEHYDGILDGGIEALAAKLLARFGPF
jgi:hypothetical protein